ncbi:MFS transporter [Carnimonas nigrificans]|uniref:MFS transporter n=1 Tax=Carnimonas nigrificans TaxID=64323 RepID=UPI000471D1D6|nr:MFS transporter [Carnimonas nigrificans]
MTTPISNTSERPPETRTLRRSVSNTLKGSVGNLIEWYDVYVYSVFAIYFEQHFFAPGEKNSTIYVWAIFAATFLMRPIGAWYFGRFADRHGRRKALTLSVMVMAACSFVIALAPTAATIGSGAALVLLAARLVQGFATGGEYGTSATYMSESAIKGWRGFLSSFHYVTLVGGQVLAQVVLLVMLLCCDAEQVSSWGWRVAFAIGGCGAIAAFMLRRSMDESLSSEAGEDQHKRSQGSMRELLVNQWKPLLICFLVTAGGTIAFYTYSVTGPRIIQGNFAGDSKLEGTVINLFVLVLLMVLQPIGGALSDKVGRKALLVFFGTGGVLYTWYLLTALPEKNTWLSAFVTLGIGFVILTGYTSINALVKAELFPAHVRALGVGFGYAVGNSAFGGTAPLLYQAAVSTQHLNAFIIYATAIMAVSLVVYIFFIKDSKESLLDVQHNTPRH